MASGAFSSMRRPSTARVTGALAAVVMLFSLSLAACGSNGGNQNNSGNHVLISLGFVGASFTQEMSPFSPNVNVGIEGPVYEPLEYVNDVTSQETPMLATGHQWSSDNKTLTFTTRQNVVWSDGQPFSANDVAFTFNMLKQFPQADVNNLWNHLTKVSASDANTVVMSFSDVDTPILPYIEGIEIVPQHLWANVGDPTKYINANPVGTGPMMLKSFTAQQITYVKNPKFWEASMVHVDELDYPAVNGNPAAILKMASHQADWAGVFDPSLNPAFVQKDATHNHIYMVPVVPAQIVPNLTDPLLGQLAVRQAISAALDRNQMAASGEAGLEQPASPSGLIPGQEKFLPASDNGTLPSFGAANPTQAEQILTTAGFKKGSDGIFADSKGHKLSFKVTVPGDFSDYVQDLMIAQQNLQTAGIQLSLNEVSDNDWRSDRNTGNFQLLMTGGFFGPTPYYYFEPLLHSTHIGGANGTNWSQWKDATTDNLLNQYATSSDPNVQTQAIQGLVTIMETKLPVIPVLDAVQFFEYTTVNWTGWPTPQDPYAVGSPYQLTAGDNEQVLLHLTPAS